MTVRLPRPPVVRVAALLGALTIALTAGCSSKALTGSSSSPTETTPPSGQVTTTQSSLPTPPPPPASGSCRQLTYSAISHYSNTVATVPCKQPHTAYTFAVQTLPADVSVTGASVGNKSIQDAASQGCRAAFDRFIGGDPAKRALSRLSVTYFLPEQKAFNQGAHWVRCDVVALKTTNSLAPLPADLAGFLDGPKALDDYGVCTDGTPGDSASALVICTDKHTYRALAAIRLGADSAPYPGVRVAGTEGQSRCATFIKETLGSAGGYTYGWTYPTVTDWAAGQRFGYCWNKTLH